jgi:hypothetical protein
MAERQDVPNTSQQRYETVDPKNPPSSVLQPEVRRTALAIYLGPLIVIAVIVGVALIYWANYESAPNEDVTDTIGTVGDEATPGGFNPDPRADTPREEVEYRGGSAMTSLGAVVEAKDQAIGRSVDLENVTVADVRSATSFSIQDGDRRVSVEAPAGGPSVRDGSRIDVSGVIESNGQGNVRIRATRIETR